MNTAIKNDDLSIFNTYQTNIEVKVKERISSRERSNWLVDTISKEVGSNVCNYINEHFDLSQINSILYASPNQYNYELLDFDNIRAIINLRKINHIRNINDFLSSINKLLPDAGIYVGCVETYQIRRRRFFNNRARA